ncbi:MAG: putative copper-transporting ATPase PacS, partial [Pseudomonadota bacterium]
VNVLTSQHKDSVAPISEPVTCASQDTARLQLLDTPEEWAEFSHPDTVTEGSWSSSVVFEGMHCAACAISIEDVLRAVPGVSTVQISSASHRGKITWSPDQTRPSEWMRSVERLGYKAVPANDAHAHERRRLESRLMVWRVAVAALCMMQVMMYATPAYLSAPGEISDEAMHLLRWASWAIFWQCLA